MIRAIRHLAPIAAAISLVLVISGDSSELDDDLQLAVPPTLPPSAAYVPLRARLYTQLRAAEGPKLERAPVEVRLESSSGATIARGQLAPARGALQDLEALLPLPSGMSHEEAWHVVAVAHRRDRLLQARAKLSIRDPIDTALPQGRALRGLQQFSAGPVRAIAEAIAPAALDVQVRGGACVPEEPCRIAVHVGAPAAALRVEANSTVSPSDAAARGSAESENVLEFTVTTHGPEAELWLIALRAGQPVARRAVRLPVALAALSAQASPEVITDAAQLRVRGLAADGGCIVDAFQDGRWRATGSFAICDHDNALPFKLGSGFWRLQLRRDPFSADTAGVANVYVRDASESDDAVAAALARAAVARGLGDDPLVRRCTQLPDRCTAPATLSYMMGVLEAGLWPLPPVVTGYADAVARTRERQAYMRTLALLALTLGGASLALSIGRTGVTAGLRASQLLADDPGQLRRARLRSFALVAASVGSLVLVFVVLALYVLARGGY